MTALPFLAPPAPDDAPALKDDQSAAWLSYGALRERRDAQARFWQTLSAPRGLVFADLPRATDSAIAYLATAASGHALGLLPAGSPRRDALIAGYDPDWIFLPAAAPPPDPERFHARAFPGGTLRLWENHRPVATPLHPDLFLVLFTSGSTGSPKAARLSYANIAHNTRAILKSLGTGAEERALLHLPLAYSFGLSVLHTQLAAGGACLLTERGLMDKELWGAARRESLTLFAGVPAHYAMLDRLGLERLAVPSLSTFLQAGGPLPPPLAERFAASVRQRQGRFFIMYGQTEAAPRMACLPLHERPDRLGSVGQALEGGRFAIEDGEVIYHGPNVMMGLAQERADLARGDELGGRLATGDTGHLDSEGFLTLTGRRALFAKLHGVRIDLGDVETAANALFPCLAFATEERLILATTEPGAAAGAALVAQVARATGLPSGWMEARYVESFPLRDTGKPDREKLRALGAGGGKHGASG